MKNDNVKKDRSKIASKILKAEMAKRGLSFSDLIEKLAAEQNVHLQVTDLRARTSRGTFSALLFIQCLRAMGVKTLTLDDSYFDEVDSVEPTTN
jgi:hypothetical protein